MKALSIGRSCLEITSPINENIVEGSTIVVQEKYECGGGKAGNVAYLLGKWGVESYIAAVMGADDTANKIKKEFENIGVKIDYLETVFDKPTGMKFITVNKTTREKTVFDLTNNVYLKKFNGNVESDIIISDLTDRNATLVSYDRNPNAITFLYASGVTSDLIEVGKLSKYIIFNKKVAEEFTKISIDFNNASTIVNAFNTIKQRFGTSELLICLGEKGCVYSINGQVKIMPPVRVEVQDTTDAGDIFLGAFAYSIGRNFGLEKSICYATIAASFSTTKYTGRLSIPTLTEVSTYYDGKFGKENNPNNTMNDKTVNMNTTVSSTSNTVNNTTTVESEVTNTNAN